MDPTAEELETLRQIALEAGRGILEVYGTGVEVWDKDDSSPLTQADLQADAVICSGLARAFPAVPVLSEESGRTGSAASERLFLVDPLDGTKEFLKRNGEFTVNIALVEAGVPIAGVVLAPALDECFFAARGLGAWKTQDGEAVAIHASRYRPGAALRIIGSRSHGADRMNAWLETVTMDYRFTAAGSSLKFCRIAEGEADVYPRLGPTSQWDTAAAQCVLECAGGCVLDLDGKPLRYGFDRATINPEFVALGDRSLYATCCSGLRSSAPGER